MQRVIREPKGWDGLLVKVKASRIYVGEYEVGIYYRGWVGTYSSPDGVGWCGVGFHGNEGEINSITQAILDGVQRERSALDEIVCKHTEGVFDKAISRGG